MIPWTGNAMQYAKAHVAAGILRVDKEGRVWRDKISNRGRLLHITPRRAEHVGGKSYLRVSLHIPELKRLAIVMAHNLVYEVLVGPIPDGLELNHEDLVKDNNHPQNLKPMTDCENIQHSYDNGRPRPWSKSTSTAWRGQPRLTPDNKEAIRQRRAMGVSYPNLSREFGVSISHVHRICHEKGGTHGNGAGRTT